MVLPVRTAVKLISLYIIFLFWSLYFVLGLCWLLYIFNGGPSPSPKVARGRDASASTQDGGSRDDDGWGKICFGAALGVHFNK